MARKSSESKNAGKATGSKSAPGKAADSKITEKKPAKSAGTKPAAVATTPKLGTSVPSKAGASAGKTVNTPAASKTKPQATHSESMIESKPTPTEEAIRLKAYELWLARGGIGGDPERDWHEARRQLLTGV